MLQNETPRFAVANILVRFWILVTLIKYVIQKSQPKSLITARSVGFWILANLIKYVIQKSPILILKIHAEIYEIAWYCDITKMTCYDLTTLKLDTLNEGHFLLQFF